MSQNSFTISYPSLNPGTDKSIINFMAGIPDLANYFSKAKRQPKNDDAFLLQMLQLQVLNACSLLFLNLMTAFAEKIIF